MRVGSGRQPTRALFEKQFDFLLPRAGDRGIRCPHGRRGALDGFAPVAERIHWPLDQCNLVALRILSGCGGLR
jgi:hypothetical protein